MDNSDEMIKFKTKCFVDCYCYGFGSLKKVTNELTYEMSSCKLKSLLKQPIFIENLKVDHINDLNANDTQRCICNVNGLIIEVYNEK